MTTRDLNPKELWNYFEDLNAIPRASKKEKQVIIFIKSFGESIGLETYVDKIGNVIIKKPATNGFENREIVILQSHLDMVHQKNNDVDFDFDKQGIQSYVDGEWVKAKGTTLGSDNGIGVATIMSILASKQIEHPRIEALFTIDEETGMTGALNLEENILEGTILLNLDTEEIDELTIGCAGGLDTSVNIKFKEETVPNGYIPMLVELKGLNGGHSGMDIHKGLGNANKLLNRILFQLHEESLIRISTFDGGGLRNAIPREAKVIFYTKNIDKVTTHINKIFSILKKEFILLDSNITISIQKNIDFTNCVLPLHIQEKWLQAVYSVHNGVYRMHPEIKDLVETSSNLARISIEKGEINAYFLLRSSVDTQKMDLANSITSCFKNIDATVTHSGGYSGWEPEPYAPIIEIMNQLYQKQFKNTPKIMSCHAGLECGIIKQHYPKLQMISYGPTIKGAHSPDEKVNIESVQLFWNFTIEALKNIPIKK